MPQPVRLLDVVLGRPPPNRITLKKQDALVAALEALNSVVLEDDPAQGGGQLHDSSME